MTRPRATPWLLGLVLLGLSACGSQSPPPDMALPPNPLPACPDSPNCVRASQAYDIAPTDLFEAMRSVLEESGASEINAVPDEDRAHAVYRVVIFKDDVHLVVAPYAGGSVLHLRSASRVGYSDLGVNGRRVRRLFRLLEAQLSVK